MNTKKFGKHSAVLSGRKHYRKLVKLLDYNELVSYKYLPQMISSLCKSISLKGSVQMKGLLFDIQVSKITDDKFVSRRALIQTASLMALHSEVKLFDANLT